MARRWFVSLFISVVLFSCQTSPHFGDLLFHVTDQGNAVTDVTPGMIDHVAIYVGNGQVIEAISEGVTTTPLLQLKQREGGYYLIGVVNGANKRQSVQNSFTYLGRNYDHLYLPDNDDIYCSELVELAYVNKNGEKVFEPIPMSFHDSNGQITPYWIRFYKLYGMEVPEGKPGTNPGELSKRKNVRIKGVLR